MRTGVQEERGWISSPSATLAGSDAGRWIRQVVPPQLLHRQALGQLRHFRCQNPPSSLQFLHPNPPSSPGKPPPLKRRPPCRRDARNSLHAGDGYCQLSLQHIAGKWTQHQRTRHRRRQRATAGGRAAPCPGDSRPKPAHGNDTPAPPNDVPKNSQDPDRPAHPSASGTACGFRRRPKQHGFLRAGAAHPAPLPTLILLPLPTVPFSEQPLHTVSRCSAALSIPSFLPSLSSSPSSGPTPRSLILLSLLQEVMAPQQQAWQQPAQQQAYPAAALQVQVCAQGAVYPGRLTLAAESGTRASLCGRWVATSSRTARRKTRPIIVSAGAPGTP